MPENYVVSKENLGHMTKGKKPPLWLLDGGHPIKLLQADG